MNLIKIIMSEVTPIHESPLEAMWAKKEAKDLERFNSKILTIDPKAMAILKFLSEYCELKLKASWSGKELHNAFRKYIASSPVHLFNFTNHATGNLSAKSDLKYVCDQVFPYKNFKTKHYYIKTQEHIETIKSQLNNKKLKVNNETFLDRYFAQKV